MRKKAAANKNSPEFTFVEPKKFEWGESSGLGPNYELEAELEKHEFGALLDHSALEGKFSADVTPVDSSSSIPHVTGILLKGYFLLQPFLREEREYLDLFARDITTFGQDLQRGREQVKELEQLRGQISHLTEEVSAAVKERDRPCDHGGLQGCGDPPSPAGQGAGGGYQCRGRPSNERCFRRHWGTRSGY